MMACREAATARNQFYIPHILRVGFKSDRMIGCIIHGNYQNQRSVLRVSGSLRAGGCGSGHRWRPACLHPRTERGREVDLHALPQQDPVTDGRNRAHKRRGHRNAQPQGIRENDRIRSVHVERHLPADRGRHRPAGKAPPCIMEDDGRRPEEGVLGSGEAGDRGSGHEARRRAVGRAAPEGDAGPRAGPGAEHPDAGRADIQSRCQASAGDLQAPQAPVEGRRPARHHDQPRPQHSGEVLRQHRDASRRRRLRGGNSAGCHNRGEHPRGIRS